MASPRVSGGVRQVPERFQGLCVARRCRVERRAVVGSDPGLPTVGHSLVPHRAPEGVQGQGLDLLGQAVRMTLFERFDNAGVEQTAAFLEETAVGDLVRQGVLESVFTLGEQAGLVQEFSCLEVRQVALQRRVGYVGNGLQQQHRHLRANDRRGLEQILCLRRQPVNARRQYRLHSGRHLNG